MVIDDVHDDLHALFVGVGHQAPEILLCAEIRGDLTEILGGVGAAPSTLAGLFADGMDGHEPQNVHAQGLDAVQVPADGFKGAFLRVIADKYGVKHLIAVGFGCCGCHYSSSRLLPVSLYALSRGLIRSVSVW